MLKCPLVILCDYNLIGRLESLSSAKGFKFLFEKGCLISFKKTPACSESVNPEQLFWGKSIWENWDNGTQLVAVLVHVLGGAACVDEPLKQGNNGVDLEDTGGNNLSGYLLAIDLVSPWSERAANVDILEHWEFTISMAMAFSGEIFWGHDRIVAIALQI